MKKRNLWIAAAVVAFSAALATPAAAHRYNSIDDGHPLKYVYYVVHPIGKAIEMYVTRPIHEIVSTGNRDVWFGHKAYLNEEETYDEFLHGNYEPSISVLREQRKKASRQMAR